MTAAVTSDVEVIRAASLAGVAHGFLGRRGGVSGGAAGDARAGLDVGAGSGDEAAAAENRRRAVAAVAPGAWLATLHQVHSAEVVTVLAAYEDRLRPRADALVTDRPGIALGIVTADCAPVLLADPDAGVIAAAHAGWKGAIAGVADSVVLAMATLGARRERIVAAIGPAIARASYEVDDGFRRRFAEADPANDRFFLPGRPGHHHFDLAAYVAHRLAAAGIGQVETIDLDTYAAPDRFYSFRRATHRGEDGYGRQISLIALEE